MAVSISTMEEIWQKQGWKGVRGEEKLEMNAISSWMKEEWGFRKLFR